jgi:hypothetical protein
MSNELILIDRQIFRSNPGNTVLGVVFRLCLWRGTSTDNLTQIDDSPYFPFGHSFLNEKMPEKSKALLL